MATAQQNISRWLTQLRDMTVSQRIAVGLGVVLIAGSLAWMAQWAASPEMSPLLDQPLSGEELALIRNGLDAIGEPYKLDGGRVLVRSGSNRSAVMAQLQQLDKLPSDLSVGFAQLVKETNPWLPQEENNRRWTVALKTELERVLRQLAGVKQAYVFLNLTSAQRGFSRNAPENKASITLITRSGEAVPRTLALAAARLVSGSVRGLPLRNVEVVDGNGVSALEWEDDADGNASGLRRLQKQIETDIAGKLREQFAFDRLLRVNVQAVLEHASRVEAKSTPSEGPPTETSKTEVSTSRGGSSAQPGVEPNVGATAGAGSDSTAHSEVTTTEKLQPGVTTETTNNPAGAMKQVFAAISVSHSYLASVWQRSNPDKQPTEADIQATFDSLKGRIESQAAKLVMPPDAKQVAVTWYYDAPAPAASVEDAGSLDVGLDIVRQYGPSSLLGVLALLALGVMMRLSKQKGAAGDALGLELGLPKEAIEAAKKAAADLRAGAASAQGSSSVGADAGVGEDGSPLPVGRPAEAMLEAREIDESEAQVTQMIEQVAAVAAKDEEGVAHLIDKWMESEKW